MLFGYIGRKRRVLTDEVNTSMTALLMNITLPCMVFMSMMRPFSRTLLIESLATVLISAAVYLSGYAVAALLARLTGAEADEMRVWKFGLMFANTAFIGFPVIQAMFGYEALIYVTMANVAFTVLVFSLGVHLFTSGEGSAAKTDVKRIALNPVMIAMYIGLVFFATGLRLPSAVENGVALIGGMTSPVSMLLVGSILAKSKLRSLVDDWRILPVIFMRLTGIPLTAFVLLRPFIHNDIMLGVIILLAAMPIGSMTVIFSEQYNGNTAMAAKLVALSTMLCLLSIPLISLII
ncbi:MAG: AEC family transporter [Defluviitaleaceae bacterium]|nr:AEC family transporter [Defluviitaleaceae bacterium]